MERSTCDGAGFWDAPANEINGERAKAFGRFAGWSLERALSRLAHLDRMHHDRKARAAQRRKAQHSVA